MHETINNVLPSWLALGMVFTVAPPNNSPTSLPYPCHKASIQNSNDKSIARFIFSVMRPTIDEGRTWLKELNLRPMFL
jgi:hypothetical protein